MMTDCDPNPVPASVLSGAVDLARAGEAVVSRLRSRAPGRTERGLLAIADGLLVMVRCRAWADRGAVVPGTGLTVRQARSVVFAAPGSDARDVCVRLLSAVTVPATSPLVMVELCGARTRIAGVDRWEVSRGRVTFPLAATSDRSFWRVGRGTWLGRGAAVSRLGSVLA